MNILFYTPVSFRCRDIESLARRFVSNGHHVFLLSQCPEGPLHFSMQQGGAETYVMNATADPLTGTFHKARQLIRFCREKQVDVCFSHLEPTNFISVLVQYFSRTRFILYRHHVEAARLQGFDQSFSYRLTYKLARTIVCVSKKAKSYMIEHEHIHAGKINHINLGYDFSLYDLPTPGDVASTRDKFPDGLILLYAGRLTNYKQPSACVEVLRKAIAANISCSVVFLGVGEDEKMLRDLAAKYDVEDRVFFMGYTDRILTFMASADLLLHPSLTESSCVVIKEAALVGLPVIACTGVGDIDEYVRNNDNGILVSKDDFVDEALAILRLYRSDPGPYRQMGINLRADIISRFHIDNVMGEYNRLIGA